MILDSHSIAPESSAPLSLQRQELSARYAAYRRRQSMRLLSMLPREAVRPLYRRACAEGSLAASDDPLALLADLCERLLPLPPMDVWLDDLAAHPDAHLEELGDSNVAPPADAPSTLAARSFVSGGSSVRAALMGFLGDDSWRGYIAFHASGEDRPHRTAAIFCEAGPTALRDRFLSLDDRALSAFLRSALP